MIKKWLIELTLFEVGISCCTNDCIMKCSRFENVVTNPLSKYAILPALPAICLNKEVEIIKESWNIKNKEKEFTKERKRY